MKFATRPWLRRAIKHFLKADHSPDLLTRLFTPRELRLVMAARVIKWIQAYIFRPISEHLGAIKFENYNRGLAFALRHLEAMGRKTGAQQDMRTHGWALHWVLESF